MITNNYLHIIILIIIFIITLFIINKTGLDTEQFRIINTNYANTNNSVELPQDFKNYNILDGTRTTDASVCEFVPYGTSGDACVERCSNTMDNVLWGGSSCSRPVCETICNSCVNKNNCKWLNPETVLVKEELLPNPVTINVISGNEEVIVLWKTNESDENNNTGFIVQYFKTYKPFEGIKIINVPFNYTKTYKIPITNLINNEYYNIGVYAINKKGTGSISNIETSIPSDNLQLSSTS
jgi:hypothetical protein